MRLAKYFIYSSLLLVLLLCVLVTLATGWISYTENGLQLLADKVSHYEPKLSFDEPSGSLLGKMQFSTIRWQEEWGDILLTDVELNIAPVCLFTVSICAKNLSLGQLIINTRSDESVADTPINLATITLPLELFLTKVNIQKLEINRDAKTQFSASDLSFKNVSWLQEKITFSQWRVITYDEKIKLAGSITLKDDYPIKANVSFTPNQIGVISRHLNTSIVTGSSVEKISLVVSGDLKLLRASFKIKGAMALAGNVEIKSLDNGTPFELSTNIQKALSINAFDRQIFVKAGEFKIRGDSKQLGFSISSIIKLPLITDDSSFELTGSSDYQSAIISNSKLSTSQGTLAVKGQLGLNDSHSTDLQLKVSDFNADFITPVYSTSLDLTAFLTIENLYSKPLLLIDLSHFEGQFLNESFVTSGSLNWRSDSQFTISKLSFKHWQLISDALQLEVNGHFPNEPLTNETLNWSAKAAQLGKLFPESKGRATATGWLSGTINKPTLSAKLQLDDVLARGIGAEKITADFDINQLAWNPSKISLHAKNVGSESVDEVVDLQINLNGQQRGASQLIANHFDIGESLASHFDLLVKQQNNWSSSISCRSFLATASLEAEVDCPQLTVLLERGMADIFNSHVASSAIDAVDNKGGQQSTEYRWTNDQPLKFSWQQQNKQFKADPFCLINGDASICLHDTTTRQTANEPKLQLSGEGLQLEWLQALTPGYFNLSGVWQFNASLQARPSTSANQERGDWQLLGAIGSQGALLSKSLENGNTIQVPLKRIDLSFNGDKNGIDSNFALQSESLGNLNGQLKYYQKTLTGSVVARRLDAQIFQGFIPNAKHLNGYFSSAIDFDVTDKALSLYGDVEFSDVDFTARSLPFDITQANVNIRFDKQSMISTGTMKIGDGDANIKANGNWQSGALHAEFKFAGESMVIHPLPDSFITLAPDLILTVQPGGIKLNGDVFVTQAHIELQSLPKNTLAESDDVIIEQNDSDSHSVQFSANINARLSDAVSFKGFGLETLLGGHLQIQSLPGQLITGNGVINLFDGRYRAYGQNLVIEEGRMIFSGPLANPELFVTAIRHYTEGDVRVGVEVTGTAKDAQLSLFSNPSKTENEILSYLLTGKAPQNTSVDESRLAQQMAISLGMAQTNSAARNIAESVGIEDFRMGTELGRNGDEAQMSGYIAPNLFLLYGVSMFDRSASITARYELSSKIYVEVYSGAASAIDIFWSVIK